MPIAAGAQAGRPSMSFMLTKWRCVDQVASWIRQWRHGVASVVVDSHNGATPSGVINSPVASGTSSVACLGAWDSRELEIVASCCFVCGVAFGF